MTETTSTTEDLELWDDATEEFPAKEDLKDRLVAIWVTGRHGTRQGTAPGSKPYAWYETTTLVLDDGPNWTGMKIVDGDSVPMLVPSVAEEGPQRLDNFQYSQGGLTARLQSRVNTTITPGVGKEVKDSPKSFKPLLGRINSRKNSQPGFSASWSIAKPTDEDKAIARKHNATIAKMIAEFENALTDAGDDADFE